MIFRTNIRVRTIGLKLLHRFPGLLRRIVLPGSYHHVDPVGRHTIRSRNTGVLNLGINVATNLTQMACKHGVIVGAEREREITQSDWGESRRMFCQQSASTNQSACRI